MCLPVFCTTERTIDRILEGASEFPRADRPSGATGKSSTFNLIPPTISRDLVLARIIQGGFRDRGRLARLGCPISTLDLQSAPHVTASLPRRLVIPPPPLIIPPVGCLASRSYHYPGSADPSPSKPAASLLNVQLGQPYLVRRRWPLLPIRCHPQPGPSNCHRSRLRLSWPRRH